MSHRPGPHRSLGRSLAAWWQATPLTAVFVVFFLIPLALVLMVSFWDFNEYELLPASR
jgi:putative spermidine/putrescine transport system permease protein